MPRSAAQVIENNFVKGLITEATGLNYPENSCIETWDCVFDFFGRVTRRPGFDYENGASFSTISKTASAINTYLWKNVTGDGLISFVVVQVGSNLHFYNASDVSQLSGGLISSTIDLTAFSPSGAPAPNLNDCQFADGLSKLYVFHPFLEHFYVTYNAGANTVSATQYTLTVRDFEGAVADPLINQTDTRPTTSLAGMNVNHLYNLYNNGWPSDNIYLTTWDTGQSVNATNGLVAIAARSDMPSLADVWWTFKNSLDFFDLAQVPNTGRGNTPAPNGHYIMTAYNMDRNAASGLTTLAVTTSGVARASTGAFCAGRVFYAGINAAGYTSKIYFSQIIERDLQVGQCYQVADPTSEDLFDLLPADGGVISIPEAGTIYKLFATQNGLMVFGYRGVWFISGSLPGSGFSATDFTVSRLSSIRSTSSSSFVDVNGVPMWWNTDGIFTVQGQPPQVQSMSISTMQTFYDEIPNASKLVAKGYFNPLEQTVQWLFSTNEPQSIDDQYTFNAVLNFDVLTGSFYPWTISPGTPSVHALVVVDGVGGTAQQSQVVDNSVNNVVDGSGNLVVAYQLTNTSITPKTKFLTSFVSGNTEFTWSEAADENYVDWATAGNSADYESYFITGYKIHGKAQEKFQSTYLYIFNQGVGQAYVQGVWDFSLTSDTGRFSTKQFLNYTDPDYANAYKRVKIRGQGVSLQYLVKSLSGQPFTMIGWSTFETGNTQP